MQASVATDFKPEEKPQEAPQSKNFLMNDNSLSPVAKHHSESMNILDFDVNHPKAGVDEPSLALPDLSAIEADQLDTKMEASEIMQ